MYPDGIFPAKYQIYNILFLPENLIICEDFQSSRPWLSQPRWSTQVVTSTYMKTRGNNNSQVTSKYQQSEDTTGFINLWDAMQVQFFLHHNIIINVQETECWVRHSSSCTSHPENLSNVLIFIRNVCIFQLFSLLFLC